LILSLSKDRAAQGGPVRTRRRRTELGTRHPFAAF
jgi:hypothetical protein